jgi:hypothetical protein
VEEEDFQQAGDFMNYRSRKSLDFCPQYEAYIVSSETVAFQI